MCLEIPRELSKMETLDKLIKISPRTRQPILLHKNHRWVIPLIAFYKKKLKMPEPWNLVVFDYHKDTIDPSDSLLQEISNLGSGSNTSISGLIRLCENEFRKDPRTGIPLNDDWVKAGMELGLIGNVVFFGVCHNNSYEECASIDVPCEKYVDMNSVNHSIYYFTEFPADLLVENQPMMDLYRKKDYEVLWETLNWEYSNERKCFGFVENPKRPVMVDIDLDAFVAHWGTHPQYRLPWTETIFKDKLFGREQPSAKAGQNCTIEWSSRRFLDELLNRSPIVTIALEPECCGGIENSLFTLRMLNRFLFDSKLLIPESLSV